jgi:hypothetical protein
MRATSWVCERSHSWHALAWPTPTASHFFRALDPRLSERFLSLAMTKSRYTSSVRVSAGQRDRYRRTDSSWDITHGQSPRTNIPCTTFQHHPLDSRPFPSFVYLRLRLNHRLFPSLPLALCDVTSATTLLNYSQPRVPPSADQCRTCGFPYILRICCVPRVVQLSCIVTLPCIRLRDPFRQQKS